MERWDFESLDHLKEHHTLTKGKSLSKFTNYPRIKVAEHEELSLIELEKKIEEKYGSCEKKAKVSIFLKMITCKNTKIIQKSN